MAFNIMNNALDFFTFFYFYLKLIEFSMNLLLCSSLFGLSNSKSDIDCVTLKVFEGTSKFLGCKKFLTLGCLAINVPGILYLLC
jgi:hypothetical protein